ncbi:glycoside hydrolase family 114 protein [Coniophora puteana RWD-64-598 SS2]|uniref:alpha-galactosidase n=1 Tax=Coniophora puteana (strain RWD-64-598) TaxID=741705 RepID=A0A5M3MHX4_CONPW|nr:glycoside hydrolase family 114 protein [Coniophora puteana RWD-64-598 SS2]EIW78245.1 glycoside hydrolase family 114 protein [Coniophora puteana RWD-64-598 SS2]
MVSTLAIGLGLCLGLSHRANALSADGSPSFKPTAGATWNIQYATALDPSTVNSTFYAWDLDMVDTPQSTFDALKAANHAVICYFSGGSRESYRTDAGDFPAAAVGKVMDGWPDENWVDTRNSGVRDIMSARIQVAKSKGCDGVDVDNVDGYGNDTGFNLTQTDGVDYVKFLSDTAHAAGLSYGLKNAGDIVPQVVDVAEWVVNEQCVQYDECDLYQPFIKANKPVFHIEYTDDATASPDFVKKSCSGGGTDGFSTLIKHMDLGNWTTTCS